MKFKANLLSAIAATIACGILAQQSAIASGKTSTIADPSSAASNKPVATGGGGGRTTALPPAPTPTAPALAQGAITFTASGPVNGSTPICTGDFRIGAYYPTLLDMTVNVSVSSLNVPDGTVLYVNALGTTGTFYAYTSNVITITGGAGICAEKIFVGLGVSLAGVVITDASGVPLFAGN